MDKDKVKKLLERSRDGKSAISFTQDAELVIELCKFVLEILETKEKENGT